MRKSSIELFVVIFVISFAFIFAPQKSEAATETIKIYSDPSDWSIQTAPYPGSWSQQFSATEGFYPTSPADVSMAFAATYNSNQGYLGIHRSFLSFDTSIVPSDATINSVKLSLYPEIIMDEYNDVYSYMNVLEGRQASANNLTMEDIEMCGDTLENPTKGAGDVDISSIATNAYLTFPLNTTGIGWVNKTGYTKLCIREGHDIENKEIVNNDNYWRESGISFYTSEAVGTTTDPYLEITYTIPDVEEQDIYALLRELIETVHGYHFPKNIEKSHMAHLKKLEQMLDSEKYEVVEKQLEAFIKKLEQDAKKGTITKSVRDDLRARAKVILLKLEEMDAHEHHRHKDKECRDGGGKEEHEKERHDR